ncbi:hypothetical protein EV363DRAFT_1106481, partial [Boletus edulis]
VIGHRLLVSIHEALCIAKGNDLPFGGVNIIFAGDFTQLPPVAQSALYARVKGNNISCSKTQLDMFGKVLWLSVSVVVFLTENMRQATDKNRPFVSLLGRLREGKCTDDDFRLLQSRLLMNVMPSWQCEDWLNALMIVYNNEVKDALNERAAIAFAQRTGMPLHWYECID